MTSFREIATIIGKAKPMIKIPPPMTTVFTNTRQKTGSFEHCYIVLKTNKGPVTNDSKFLETNNDSPY